MLARHGATEWSEDGRHTSTTDLPLTDRGRADGLALAPALGGRSFVLVATSPLARALDTCRLAGLGSTVGGGCAVWDELVEWDYGDYEGVTTADIRAERPGWELFRDGCPGGESPAQVGARADAVIARVGAERGDSVLFSHGHFLRVLAARWVGWPVEAGLHLLLDTGTLSELGARRGDPVIRRWNAPAVAGRQAGGRSASGW